MNRVNCTIISIIVLLCSLSACRDEKVCLTLKLAGEHRSTLDSVLNHYRDDDPRHEAAAFLIGNMYDKYSYEGEILEKYDHYFSFLEEFRKRGITGDGNPYIKHCWDSVYKANGPINISKLSRKMDCQNLSFDYLISNIEDSYKEWKEAPDYIDDRVCTYLDYVLPYRVSHEAAELFRQKYADRLRVIRDTASTPQAFLKAIAVEFKDYHHGENLKRYSADLSVSQMERSHNGTCRHNTLFCTLVLRSLGLPVTMDFVSNWGNRSEGHSWNVMFLKDGIFPFNAFRSDSVDFGYTPAKIFRMVYSTPDLSERMTLIKEVPASLWAADAIDVTGEYLKTHDVVIENPIQYDEKQFSYAVICIFDNRRWNPVWYGPVKNGALHFSQMNGGVVYLAGYYQDGDILPAAPPFLLKEDGTMESYNAAGECVQDMILKRKYPRLKRMELFAQQLRMATIEGSNRVDFKYSDTLMYQTTTPVDMCDTLIDSKRFYQFFRWHIADFRIGNIAEIEFYGKDAIDGEEHLLKGTVMGRSESKEPDGHPFIHAMDGDPATWFSKPKNTNGWVGIDLGQGNKAILTRVRYCPRSDTNFILQGDTYELLYWKNDGWHDAGSEIAKCDSLVFKQIPTHTIYWLRDLTKGREERIFTYQDGKQVWW